ncbi:MAG: N-6 DNA methylase [Planctomycetes bacterium]|nr:N-6 DNA methylase [Planctomycetota bacterium]
MLEHAWKLHQQAFAALGEPARKALGGVFTPRELALRLAGHTLESLRSPAPTVLDPACGAGALLLGALEWAARNRPEWLTAWSKGALRGWELDPAVAAAATNVLAAAATELGVAAPTVACRDALSATGDHADVVLCNPPWTSYSGRQAGQLPPERKQELQRRFAAFRGWPALHAAFAERCAELGTRLGLLLPMQVTDLPGYAAARQALADEHRLVRLDELGERAFEGVTEPAVLLVLEPGVGAPGPWHAAADPALEAAVSRFRPLPAGCFADMGIHTGNAASLLITRKPEAGCRPVRVGRDITPFCVAEPTHFVRKIDLPHGAYARVPGDDAFARVRIVLRQTAARPIAAPNTPPLAFRNSVLACFGAPGHDDDYLLGVLNSDTVARIHRLRFRDARQRAFPQLKIAHLRALPVPGREIGPLYEQIARLARQARSNAGADLPAELDELVAQAYGVNR